MRSRIGLFEETGIRRSGQPPEELDLRTVIDECFFVEMVSENLEEIGNLQRMLCENFAVCWIERAPQMVSLRSGCNHDIGPRPIATRLWEYRVGEKMGQLVEFLHLQVSTQLPITAPMRRATHNGLPAFFGRSLRPISVPEYPELIYCSPSDLIGSSNAGASRQLGISRSLEYRKIRVRARATHLSDRTEHERTIH